MLASQRAAKLAREVEAAVNEAKRKLDLLDQVRELGIKLSREVVRLSGLTVTSLVAGDVERAKELLKELETKKKELAKALSQHGEILYSGFVEGALSEYAEAKLLYAMLLEGRVPPPSELGVSEVAYVLGLGDLVGELRRAALEKARSGDLNGAWEFLEVMEATYSSLRSLDYPDALVPGLRHKVDVARRLVDETKSLLLELASRKALEEKISRFARHL